MENKKYLTEENYEKGKKKLKTLILVILTIGILFGGGLILTGIIKTNTIKSEIAKKESQRTESDVQTEIAEVESKIININTEITNLNTEKSKIFQEDRGYSDRYYAKDEEITAKQNEKTKLARKKFDLETELLKIQSGFNETENTISSSKYKPFYMIGTFIILVSGMISIALYTVLKRREIAAFTAQQVMPVAKEGIEEMAPTIGNAVGEITKGIKKGLEDEEK